MDLTAQQMKAKLERGWQGYQEGPESKVWTSKLQAVLHPEIVWHDLEPSANPQDYEGRNDVMAHFVACWNGPYRVPQGRVYHVVHADHAIVSDQLANEPHRCVDIYRFEDDLIREMWTCVNHPVEAGVVF